MHGGAGSLLPAPQAAQTPHLLFSVEHLVEITVVGLTVRHCYHLQGRGKSLLLEPGWDRATFAGPQGVCCRSPDGAALAGSSVLLAPLIAFLPSGERFVWWGPGWDSSCLVSDSELQKYKARKNQVCSLGDPGAERQLPAFVSRE